MRLIIAVIVCLFTTSLFGDTRFYQSNGRYAGRMTTSRYGNSTVNRFYGSNGRFQGSARSYGSTTNLYGVNGRYQGRISSR